MKKCINCGKELSKTSQKRKNSKYCKKCYLQFMKKEHHPNWKGGIKRIIRKCKICKKILELSAFYANTKRCQKCYLKTIKGKNHPNYKKGTNQCIDCNKDLKKYDHLRCWDCYCIWAKNPKNNPAYIDGNSHLPYPSEWHQIRKIIRQRDNFRCAICNKNSKDVHHIDYNKLNCKEDNLITLCHRCHLRTNTNRDYWYAYFTYIMENK